ncbi:AraC family transcriptional regulator [Wandonia haliotis]|uniref:AraC family transcriptional regulator n=1 Tax=Wandonia haliotis TaxID=574963 RepID=A0ABN1MSL1_9FLAO
MSQPVIHVKTLSEVHAMFGLPKPKHPLISVLRHADLQLDENFGEQRFSADMYMISLKDKQQAEMQYGRNTYDFQEGTMVFIAPDQVFATRGADFSETGDEWSILVHKDFITQSDLWSQMSNYHFFKYESNEALHLSDEEKKSLTEIVQKIEREYHQRIDKHTNEIISINLESLLKYCQRYYDRQFITRKSINKGFLVRFENFLKDYFADDLAEKGMLTVAACGKALNMSDHYMSDLLKAETGKSAKEHIDLFLIDKAKQLLLQSEQSISEIAYELGFNYPNHFSKLFKSKTGLSPSEFRSYS